MLLVSAQSPPYTRTAHRCNRATTLARGLSSHAASVCEASIKGSHPHDTGIVCFFVCFKNVSAFIPDRATIAKCKRFHNFFY